MDWPQTTDLEATYDRIAEQWHGDHRNDNWWVEGTDRFIGLLAPGSRVLDAGCGSGVKSRYLAERGLAVTGLDFSKRLLEIARRENPTLTFVCGRMECAHGFGEQSFGGVFAQASLLHVPRSALADVVRSLASVLVPGGYFYVAVKGPQSEKLLEEVKEERDYGYPYRRFFSYYTPADIEVAFAEAAIEPVYQDVTRVGHTDWVQVIGRAS